MAEKMALVLFSGTDDKMLSAAILTAGAVSMDMEVDLFVTFYGLASFRKDQAHRAPRMSKDFDDLAPALVAAMAKKKVPGWYETLKKAKEVGPVRIHACSAITDTMEWKKDDFIDLLDDVISVQRFLALADDAKFMLFI